MIGRLAARSVCGSSDPAADRAGGTVA